MNSSNIKILRKKIMIGVFFANTFVMCSQKKEAPSNDAHYSVSIDAKKSTESALLLVALGEQDTALTEVCDAIKRTLEYTGQFDVAIEFHPERFKKQQVLDLHDAYDLVLFLNDNKRDHGYEWRLYDTYKATMQKGFRVSKDGKLARGWGYAVADSLIPVLTGNKPFSSCKLLYSQQTKQGENVVCVADFDGSYPTIVSHSKTSIIAPRWNKDPEDPFVLYSQYTPSNIQLVSCSLHGKKSVAVNFDGLTMQPSFSVDGKEILVSLSIDGSSQIYHYGYDKKTQKIGYTRLTYNTGNNLSPCFLENGDIVFCSDYEFGRPYIYQLKKDGSIKRLTNGGSSVSPDYNPENKKIVYSKMVKGCMQAHMYDFVTGTEQQITFDKGHKQECTWSACGNYVVYAYQDEGQQRIATHSLLTGKRKFLTPSGKNCNYPSWSVLYRPFPVIG